MLDEIWRAGHLGAEPGTRPERGSLDYTESAERDIDGWQRLGFDPAEQKDLVAAEGEMFGNGGELALECLVRVKETTAEVILTS